MVRWVTGRSSRSDRSSGSGTSARKRSPKGEGKGKGKDRRVKFEEACPIQDVYRGDPEKRKSHMNVPPDGAVLDCGAANILAGAEPAAMLTQACEKRGRKVEDDLKVEAVEEKYHFRGIGEQVITSFIKLQVPRTFGGQGVHNAPNIIDGSSPPLVGNDQLLPWGFINPSMSW